MEHWSDCAVNNAPAYEPGPCNCGGYKPDGEPQANPEPEIKLSRSLADLLNKQ